MTYEVKLDVFEGPFELLLGLIGERRLDVCDVPIARLTEDYLAHLKRLEACDLEVTTEFLVVAATLLQLKARALLPQPSGLGEDTEEQVERDLLVARLLEVRTFQAAGAWIADRLKSGDAYFPPRPAPDDEALRRLPSLGDLSADGLARTLVTLVREQITGVDTDLLLTDEITTQEASRELHAQLRRNGTLRFSDIARGRSVAWAVALFCALLEMALRGEVDLGTGERIGDIEIVLTQGDEEA
jgi:segregation and condensation protein A